jgi:calcineurin-like phosphoesterase family protein
MTVFFTADTHFGHGGARGLFGRPFGSVAAMDEALVRGWNEVVCTGDTVWHLGDFAVRQPERRLGELFAALAGTKHLVAGNNDGEATRALAWASVRDYAEISESGRSLVLCHYPLRSWNRMGRGALNLHGHSHGRLKPLPRQVDVGVDVWGFRPVPLAQILERSGRRPARRTGVQVR